jgi:hypothetical protein
VAGPHDHQVQQRVVLGAMGEHDVALDPALAEHDLVRLVGVAHRDLGAGLARRLQVAAEARLLRRQQRRSGRATVMATMTAMLIRKGKNDRHGSDLHTHLHHTSGQNTNPPGPTKAQLVAKANAHRRADAQINPHHVAAAARSGEEGAAPRAKRHHLHGGLAAVPHHGPRRRERRAMGAQLRKRLDAGDSADRSPRKGAAVVGSPRERRSPARADEGRQARRPVRQPAQRPPGFERHGHQ